MFQPEKGSGSAYVPLNTRPLGGHELLLKHMNGVGEVLDVGCSTGYLSRRLVERGAVVTGIELDEQAAAQARDVCREVLTGDVETMQFPFPPASFDAVLCADLIEHLRDPGLFLARIRPLLRSGGRLVLSTPNVANWSIRVSLLFGRFKYGERGILDRTHTHLFTRATLTECLEAAGYRVEAMDYTVPVPVLGERFPSVDRIAHAIGSLRPQLFAFQFVAAATPE